MKSERLQEIYIFLDAASFWGKSGGDSGLVCQVYIQEPRKWSFAHLPFFGGYLGSLVAILVLKCGLSMYMLEMFCCLGMA